MSRSSTTRTFEERIAEIDGQLTILMGKREKLDLLRIAKLARDGGHAAQGRALRALVDAGLMEKAHDVAAVLRPIVDPPTEASE